MNQIVFATKNEGKLREIRQILGAEGIRVISMREAGLDPEIVENGATFRENAIIKARTVAEAGNVCAMADDSGLVIDALGGEPGIYSARYLGEDTPYHVKNAMILERMKDVAEEKRTARFVCAVAMYLPGGCMPCTDPALFKNELAAIGGETPAPYVEASGDALVLAVEAAMEGRIAFEAAGENGFGYDPVLYLPEYGCTSAQLSSAQKNAISHRGKALRSMRMVLRNWPGAFEN